MSFKTGRSAPHTTRRLNPPATTARQSGNHAVLIIEDNPDILANLYGCLEPLGYTLDCARNGFSGLACAPAIPACRRCRGSRSTRSRSTSFIDAVGTDGATRSVEYGQGWLFGKPMPAQDFIRYARPPSAA